MSGGVNSKMSFSFISVAQLGLLTRALKHGLSMYFGLLTPWWLGAVGEFLKQNLCGASVLSQLSGSCMTVSYIDLKSNSGLLAVLSWVKIVTILTDSREGDTDRLHLSFQKELKNFEVLF